MTDELDGNQVKVLRVNEESQSQNYLEVYLVCNTKKPEIVPILSLYPKIGLEPLADIE